VGKQADRAAGSDAESEYHRAHECWGEQGTGKGQQDRDDE
jgi:hypothetical protein